MSGNVSNQGVDLWTLNARTFLNVKTDNATVTIYLTEVSGPCEHDSMIHGVIVTGIATDSNHTTTIASRRLKVGLELTVIAGKEVHRLGTISSVLQGCW